MSAATEQAFLAAPRHLFVKRYCLWASPEWHAVDETNLQQHLPTLYHKRPLILFGDDDENVPTTISQPSFVLSMLDMLQLEPGYQIFELDTGSGWNAILMGQLVGPIGHVYSLEIIPELARTAADTFVALGIENVSIVEADGGESYTPGAPYDRAYLHRRDLRSTPHFYQQVKEDGLLLMVIKNEGGGDRHPLSAAQNRRSF